jgi:hypothetical protein
MKRLWSLLVACFHAPRARLRGASRDLPLVDAHIHYSHDAWEIVPPKQAAELLRKSGVKRALVSSSNDDGTQKLLAEAPDIIIPELRPYRTRADTAGWVRDEGIIAYLEERLRRHVYVAIGEFHLYGADADLPVPRRMVALAKKYDLMLHAHSDAGAVERLFAQWPQARILWAHSGFERPEKVREMLRKHKNLWADLAFRSDHGAGGKPPPGGARRSSSFPDRFMVGTDTRARALAHACPSIPGRAWLADLPPESPSASRGRTARRCSAPHGRRRRRPSSDVPARGRGSRRGACGRVGRRGSLRRAGRVCARRPHRVARHRPHLSHRSAAHRGRQALRRRRGRLLEGGAERVARRCADAAHRHGMNHARASRRRATGTIAPTGCCFTCRGSGSSCSISNVPGAPSG